MHARGFTLVELLTVIAIIFILTGLVLSNLRSARDHAAAEQAALDLIALMREARQNSLAVREHAGMYPSYGVYVKKGESTAVLFADCKADDDAAGSNSLNKHDTFDYTGTKEQENCGAGNTDVERLTFAGGVIVEDIEADTIVHKDNITHFSVQFLQPEPTLWFVGKKNESAAAEAGWLDMGTVHITLKAPSDDTVVVSINSAGLITSSQQP